MRTPFVFVGVSHQELYRVSLPDIQLGQLSPDKLLFRGFRNLVPPLELDLVVQLLGFLANVIRWDALQGLPIHTSGV